MASPCRIQPQQGKFVLAEHGQCRDLIGMAKAGRRQREGSQWAELGGHVECGKCGHNRQLAPDPIPWQPKAAWICATD